jgi:competence protein ComGC
MYNFRMLGIIKDSKNQETCEVLYKNGKLTGDKTLVQALKAQAELYKIRDESIAGISLREEAYIKDAKDVIYLMRELCHHAQIWGNHPYWR